MRKVFALMLLISLVAMLTGCVEDERYWTLPLEDGFEVWCEDGERMLVRETDWLRYAFVVRGIESPARGGQLYPYPQRGESYAFVETATGAVARTASGEDGFRRCLRGAGAGRGRRVDVAGQPARDGDGPLAQPLRRHHAPAAGRGVTSAFEGYAEGELPTPRSGLYMNSHGGFHGDGDTFANCTFAPEDGKAVERLLEDSGWLPLPATGPATSYIGDSPPCEICSMDGVGPVLPDAKNGWWRFADTTPGDNDHIYNYVFWLYDADAAALYYHEFEFLMRPSC